ncbi:hypothetical protein HDE_10975 [Halotydeus destructor]|nr:hypothetical protein HDE_10975 [Halotydeus destructor]
MLIPYRTCLSDLPACNVFILYIWGKASQPYMQALHFAFGVGGLVAPLLASPFLSTGEAPIEGLAHNLTSAIENQCDREELLIHIPYAILGASCLLTAMLFLYLFCCHRQTGWNLASSPLQICFSYHLATPLSGASGWECH